MPDSAQAKRKRKRREFPKRLARRFGKFDWNTNGNGRRSNGQNVHCDTLLESISHNKRGCVAVWSARSESQPFMISRSVLYRCHRRALSMATTASNVPAGSIETSIRQKVTELADLSFNALYQHFWFVSHAFVVFELNCIAGCTAQTIRADHHQWFLAAPTPRRNESSRWGQWRDTYVDVLGYLAKGLWFRRLLITRRVWSVQGKGVYHSCGAIVTRSLMFTQSTMQRHRMIYSALSEELSQGLHALSLKTRTMEEVSNI